MLLVSGCGRQVWGKGVESVGTGVHMEVRKAVRPGRRLLASLCSGEESERESLLSQRKECAVRVRGGDATTLVSNPCLNPNVCENPALPCLRKVLPALTPNPCLNPNVFLNPALLQTHVRGGALYPGFTLACIPTLT